MQVYERTVITMALHPAKVWERFHDDVYSILKRKHLENLFHHINNHHQNIKFIMKEESNRELAFLDSFSSRVSLLVYRKPTQTEQYLYYSSHHQTSGREVLFRPHLIKHIALSPMKMTYTKKTSE